MNPTVALIPSAYKSGLVYSILPASGRGDFNFNRPSSATRVNKDGLVEEMYIDVLGTELLTTGVITNSNGAIMTFIANGINSVSDGTSTSVLRPRLLWSSLTLGAEYRIIGTPTINSGTTTYSLYDGASYVKQNEAIGAFDITFTCNGSSVTFTNDGRETFDIDWDLSIKEVSVNGLPRLDYTNGNCPQLLLEPQSSNLALYSGDLTNAEWEPFGNVVVTGGYIAPDGTNSAVKVSCDNIVSNSVLIQQSIGNSTRSRTIYARTVKTGTTGIANLCSYHGNNNNDFTITDQWQRFEVNGTSTSAGQSDFYGIDFRGTTDLDEILLWGGQIENLTYATSYIPTEATSVTRSRDLMTDSMASRPEITSDDWTLFLDFNKSDLGSDNCVSINDGTNDNSIVINNRADDELAFILNQGGTVLSSYIYDITGIDDLKVSFSSTDTGASMVVNGVEIDRLDDGRFDASSLIQIDFTEYGTTNEFAGRVNDFRYYNVALSLNERIALTK